MCHQTINWKVGKWWETSGICHKRGFVREHGSKSCCQDPAALTYSKAAKSIGSSCTFPALSSFPPVFSCTFNPAHFFFLLLLPCCFFLMPVVVPWKADQPPWSVRLPCSALPFALEQTKSPQKRHLLVQQSGCRVMGCVAGSHLWMCRVGAPWRCYPKSGHFRKSLQDQAGMRAATQDVLVLLQHCL